MPVRVYDIARRLRLSSGEVVRIASVLGIAQAKVASSVLDKVTGEFLEVECRRRFDLTSAGSPSTEQPGTCRTPSLASLVPEVATSKPKLPTAPRSNPPAAPERTVRRETCLEGTSKRRSAAKPDRYASSTRALREAVARMEGGSAAKPDRYASSTRALREVVARMEERQSIGFRPPPSKNQAKHAGRTPIAGVRVKFVQGGAIETNRRHH